MNPLNCTQQINTTSNCSQRIYTYLTAVLFLLAPFFLKAQDVLVGLTSNGGPEGMGTAFTFRTDTKAFSVVKGFANWGENPVASLVKGTDGQLYGVAPNGGTYGHGTIFRISTSGTVTMLKHFNLAVDGGYPKGSLMLAKDGNFYGTTESGGPNSGGVVFRITPAGQYSIIKSFNVNTDGGRPAGRLLQASDGNLYGVNRTGGSTGYGTIFRLKLDGTYAVIKTFNYTADGGNCYGGLIQATDNALYGMTRFGGAYGYGTVFRITMDGLSFKVTKHLNRNTDAAYPTGDLIQAKNGMLYGMASTGVGYNGVAFRMNLTGTSFSIIHQFNPSIEGGNPGGSLIQGSDGFFYGTTSILSGGYGGGVFKMDTIGRVSLVKKFTPATDGNNSVSTLVQGPDGFFYGMTQYGGKNEDGTIFKVNSTGTFSVLAHMNGATLGNTPQDNLALAKDSAYYGVTRTGGAYNWGTIFKICGGVTTVLKSFNKNVDGGSPSAGLVRGKDGNLYGATESGGSNGGGTIFRITPAGAFTVLRHMKATTDGEGIRGTLALAAGTDSSLYGVTYGGGTGNSGTVFKITLKGVFTVLRHFVSSTDGDHSESGLTLKDGVFYGITGFNSRFFKITPDGQFAALKTLSYTTDGNTPLGNMIVGADGNLYGTLSTGGSYGKGVIFKMTTAGIMTKLKHLNGTTDGSFPRGSLIQAADGALYGTTFSGGANGVGTIYKITTGGLFTLLKSFNLAQDGGNSLSGMIIAPKVSLVANPQSGLVTNEDVAKTITLSGSGATTLTYAIVIAPKNGTVSSGTTASRTYKPGANFNGVDSFAFTTNLGCFSSAPAWVKITINPVNDAPVLATIGNKTVVKGSTLTFTAIATDPDKGQTKTFSLLSAPTGATINATSGAFSWTPATTGTFTFSVRVTDNGSPVLYDQETITVTVTAPAFTQQTAPAVVETKFLGTEPVLTGAAIYPNPVVSYFTLSWKQPVDAISVSIVDAGGRLVYTKQFKHVGTQVQVTDANLKPGGYLVLLQSGEEKQTLKLIKL